jgi:uncharacterized protein involved in exopolysaccharide biosynthesis
MINEIIRNALYFIDLALRKPLYGLLPALLVVLGGAYFIFTMQRPYQSDALLLLQFQQIPTTLVSPTVSNDRMQFIEQRILSRKNLLTLADNHKLFSDLAPTMPRSQLAGLVRNQISLNIQFVDGADRNASNGTVRIGFRYADPKIAADVVSDLVAQIIEENRRMRISQASETARFLTSEVANLAQRFEQRSQVWKKYVEENGAAHPARVPALLIELQAKEQELASLDRSILTLNEEIRVYEAQIRNGLERTSPTARLIAQLRTVEAEIATKSLTFSSAHPEIRGLKQHLEDLKAQIAAMPPTTPPTTLQLDPGQEMPPELALASERLSGAKPQQMQAVAQRGALVQRIEELRATIAKAPEVLAQITAQEAEKVSLQRTLDDMQAKLDAARLGERLEVGDGAFQIEVIEEPEVPVRPGGPRRAFLALGVCLAAAAAAAAGIYLAHLLDRTIRGTFDLADTLAGETLVVVPQWSPKKHVAKAFRDPSFPRAGPA